MKKLFIKIASVCLAVVSAAGLCACGDSGGKGEGVNGYLKISAVKLGYGVDWLNAMIEEFEKSSGINVDLSVVNGAAGQDALDDEIESLASDTDLFFNKRGWFAKGVYEGSISAKGKNYDCLYADLSDVWNSVADEGSAKTVKDKMDATYANAFDIEGKYYALPWAGGVYGIVRNLSVWKDLGLTDSDVPYTTNELFELCDKIKANKAPFIYSLKKEYYSGWLPIFFAQYEGKENAENFMKGLDPDGELSENLYTYDGQVEAIKILKTLLDSANGYQYSRSESIDFTAMQGLFIRGEALFSINGSWLETEASNFDNAQLDMIKTPVISSIVNKLSFCPTEGGKKIKYDNLTAEQRKAADEKLSEVIKYVDKTDAGETAEKPAGVTDEDIKIVTEARHYSYMAGGTDHQAYVPSYSSHIREAKEFLKFMYSDKGLNIYYKTLKGTTLPATPVGGYEEGVTLSEFRKSVNAATKEDFTFDRVEKARLFVLNNVNAYFSNGVTPVTAIREGKTPQEIININDKTIRDNWEDYKQKLGIK